MAIPEKMERKVGHMARSQAEAQFALWRCALLMDVRKDEQRRHPSPRCR